LSLLFSRIENLPRIDKSEAFAKHSHEDAQTGMLLQSKLFIDYTIIFLTDLSITDQFGRTPLHNAILGQHNVVVQLLLSGGADVRVRDERSDTPLHTAVRTGDERILQVGAASFKT